jgi:hypothetical protein
MTAHQRIRDLERLLSDVWRQNGRRVFEYNGTVFGDFIIRYSSCGDVVETEQVSLTALAEEIARELDQ